MDLQDTLEQYVLQLKNTARTLEGSCVCLSENHGNAL